MPTGCLDKENYDQYSDFLPKKEKAYLDQVNVEDYSNEISNNDNIISDMAYQQLLDTVRELPLGCQSVFNLYAIEGYQHNEIAELLGISEGTSKSQYARQTFVTNKNIGES
ncbi:MAG: sigma-70 region 4 domain-containing protein [Spirosomataceae bacterium]